MIQYDETIPFVEHFGMYQVPDTLADAVEQYRIDSLRSVMEKLHVGPEIFELLVTEDDSVTDDFGTLCDPLGYYADSLLSYVKPATSASSLRFRLPSPSWASAARHSGSSRPYRRP
jgi:hypothetical protein